MQEDGQKQVNPPLEADQAAAGEGAMGNGSQTAPTEGTASTDPVVALTAELASAKRSAQEHYDAFLRARAEAENVRRRAEDDISKARKFGAESFAESLLPVMDSLEAALANPGADTTAMREGVELTLRQLVLAFEKNRLAAINPAGEKFDPHRHQAISMEPSTEVAANHVTSVLQKGWMLADRVLRPALVKVAQPG